MFGFVFIKQVTELHLPEPGNKVLNGVEQPN